VKGRILAGWAQKSPKPCLAYKDTSPYIQHEKRPWNTVSNNIVSPIYRQIMLTIQSLKSDTPRVWRRYQSVRFFMIQENTISKNVLFLLKSSLISVLVVKILL
jgi:hypothetical protein